MVEIIYFKFLFCKIFYDKIESVSVNKMYKSCKFIGNFTLMSTKLFLNVCKMLYCIFKHDNFYLRRLVELSFVLQKFIITSLPLY